jgi:hypothetical protein
MLRYLCIAALAVASLPNGALAITAKQKMETCKFGADDQKLEGAARKTFLNKCMAKGEPPGSGAPAAKPVVNQAGAPPAKQSGY